jgi:hypothetical protein
MEPAADQPLGLEVRVRLVPGSPRAAGPVEVGAQHVAGLARRSDRDGEGAAQVGRGRNSGQVRTGWAG